MKSYIKNSNTIAFVGAFRTLILLLSAVTFIPGQSRANVLTWTGGTASSWPFIGLPNWSAPGNWSPAVAPQAGDTLIFPPAALQSSSLNDLQSLTLSWIQINGASYTIGGNAFTLINRIDATNGTATVIANDITLESTATMNVNVGSSSSLTLSGAIGGWGSITKVGPGTLTFGGASANTYSGPTTVNEGTLQLGKSSGYGIPNGPLTIGDGIGGGDADVVRYIGANGAQIPVGVPIIVNSSGLLDLNGVTGALGGITFAGGDIATGSGTLEISTDITVLGSDRKASLSGNAHLSGGTRTITLATAGSMADALAIFANLNDDGGGLLITNGSSAMLWVDLLGNNGFTGPLTISKLGATAETATALGAASGTVTIDRGTLTLFGTTIANKALILAGGSTLEGTDLCAWTGPITLSGNAFFNAYPAEDPGLLDLQGRITGTGDVYIGGFKSGVSVRFSGAAANDYSGVTYVGNASYGLGVLELNKSVAYGAIPHALVVGYGGANGVVRLLSSYPINYLAPVTITDSGLLDMNGQSASIGSLSGTGGANISLGTIASSALYVNYDNGSSTYAGQISGAGNFYKEGTGTLTLPGKNTYTGTTYADAGTLLINGAQPQSPVVVSAGATLGGSGVVGAVSSWGTISPGNSSGVLTTSNVNFSSSGAYVVDLTGATPGTGYDQVNVRGTVNLNNVTLTLRLAFTGPVGVGQQFVLINNDLTDPVTGTFNGLPEGSVISAGGIKFAVSYTGGDGNDVVLTVTHAPLEPAHFMLTSGNGSGALSPNACNGLQLVVTNTTEGPLTGITATLTSTDSNVLVTQPNSAYPDAPAYGTATNFVPFQISTLPSFVCGNTARLTLTVTSLKGVFTAPIVLTSGEPAATPLRYDVNANVAIPDIGMVESTNTVSGFTGTLAKVGVSFYLTHSYDQDLTNISLVAPDGTTVLLSSANGAGGQNYGEACSPDTNRTTFDDAAMTAITGGVAPFVGTYRPQGSLAAFYGTMANGNWRLRLQDGFGGSLGTLRCWSLLLYPATCAEGGGACALGPGSINSALTTSCAVQTGALVANGVSSACSGAKSCPGINADGALRYYQAYPFYNGPSNACVTVTLGASRFCPTCDFCALFSAAYLGSFDPANVCGNYLADSGNQTDTYYGWPSSHPTGWVRYSFNVPPNSVFVVTVNGMYPGLCGSASAYNLTVSGQDSQPLLNLTPAGAGQLELTWPTLAGDYQLETTPSLESGAWTQVTDQPLASGSLFHLTNKISSTPSRFYRLHKP